MLDYYVSIKFKKLLKGIKSKTRSIQIKRIQVWVGILSLTYCEATSNECKST
jgi:hypothetical protein